MDTVLKFSSEYINSLENTLRELLAQAIPPEVLHAKNNAIALLLSRRYTDPGELWAMTRLSNFILGHQNQLIYGVILVAVVAMFVQLGQVGRKAEVAAILVNIALLCKIFLHYSYAVVVAGKAGEVAFGDHTRGYQLIGELYNPLMLAVELVVVLFLAFMVIDSRAKWNRIGSYVNVFLLVVLGMCITTNCMHMLASAGAIKDENMFQVLNMNSILIGWIGGLIGVFYTVVAALNMWEKAGTTRPTAVPYHERELFIPFVRPKTYKVLLLRSSYGDPIAACRI